MGISINDVIKVYRAIRRKGAEKTRRSTHVRCVAAFADGPHLPGKAPAVLVVAAGRFGEAAVLP